MTRKPNVPFVLLMLAAVLIAVIAVSAARGQSLPKWVPVVYLAPDDVRSIQEKWSALQQAQTQWNDVIDLIAKNYAQVQKPETSGVFYGTPDLTFSPNYWQDSRPQPPLPAPDHQWRDDFPWGFQFLDDFSGIIPTPAPGTPDEKSATIQLFKR